MDSRVRASPKQLLTLLMYMETHGDLGRPPGGPQGRIRSDRLWSELTNILNGGGVNKTTEKWKKVWADWKTKTKKKGLTIRQRTRGTGGGPASRQTLSGIEKRVLAVMGAVAVEGQTSVEELGFNRSQSPGRDDPLIVDGTVYLEIEDGTSHLPSPPSPQPSTSKPSNSWLLPSTTSQIQTPPSCPLMRATRSSQGQQPAAPSPAASPSPPAPAAPTTPRRLQPPATPPSSRLRSSATPQSASSPGRSRLRARRQRLAPTPFERVASEFTALELRRLEMEETRTRLQHERDLRALEVKHERNQVFRSLVNVAQACFDCYRSRDNTAGRPRFRVFRRKQAPIPDEEVASEFTDVELRRLEMEETRTRLQHERDLRALEVENERKEVFRSLLNVAQACLDGYRSRDNTESMKIE